MSWWAFAIFVAILAMAGGFLLRSWRRRQKEFEEKVEEGVEVERDVPMLHFGVLLFALILLLGAVGRELTRLESAEAPWQAAVLLVFAVGLLAAGIYMTYELVFKKDETKDDGAGGLE